MLHKGRYIFVLWLALVAVYSVLRSHTFLAALVHDDGLFLYGGQAWADGWIPYRDAWDHKAPGILFFHSLPFRLFPFSLPAVKFHLILWIAASAAILFYFSRKYFSFRSCTAALALYVLYTSQYCTVRTGGLTEEDALCFVALAYWMALRRSGSRLRKAFLSGLALGIAFQFRQTFIFSFVFVLGAILKDLRDQDIPFRKSFDSILSIAAGILLPEILVSSYFWLHGAWYDYFEASYLINFYYVGPGRPDQTIGAELYKQWLFIRSTGPYLYSPLPALAVYKWIPRTSRWILVALLGTYAGELFSIGLSGEYYEHYYVQASISMALFFTLFFEGIKYKVHALKKAGYPRNRTIPVLAWISVLLLVTVIPLFWGVQRYISDYRAILSDRGNPTGTYAFQQDVARVAEGLTQPQDTVLLIGKDPNSVYILSHRHAGSRYYHFSPLWKEKLTGTVKERHLDRFALDLQSRRPVLLLLDLAKMDREEYFGMETEREELARIQLRAPEVLPYILENYMPLEDVIPYDPEEWFWYGTVMKIWVRKDNADEVRNNFIRNASLFNGRT